MPFGYKLENEILEAAEETLDEVKELEQHFHTVERWYGASAVLASLTPYALISGNGIFGTEVLLLDTGDTPAIVGKTHFDPHRILVDDADKTTPYMIRFIFGTGTVGDAESAGQYSDLPFRKIISTGSANGSASPIKMPRLPVGTFKIWAKIKNATNLATLDLFIGTHEYPYA